MNTETIETIFDLDFDEFVYELEDIFDRLGGTELDVRADYSGRGMFGSTCVAYCVGGGEAPLLAAAITVFATEQGVDMFDARDLIPTRQDGMGLGIVVY